jgi:hypothetical protein
MRFRDISLQQFGRLTASFPIGRLGKRILWACLCDCGEVVMVSNCNLISGNTASCGCLRAEKTSARSLGLCGENHPAFKHGHNTNHGQSATNHSWCAAVQRCTNPNSPDWKNYGALGIRVCERWRNSFEAFLADVGERPSLKHTISRFLDSGHYEPGNVEWATWAQQRSESKGKTAMLAFRAWKQQFEDVAA